MTELQKENFTRRTSSRTIVLFKRKGDNGKIQLDRNNCFENAEPYELALRCRHDPGKEKNKNKDRKKYVAGEQVA